MDEPRRHNRHTGRLPAAAPSAAELEALRREIERLHALASRDRGLLAAILHHSPHGIILCDAQGRLTLHNRAAERIWAGSTTAATIADWSSYRAFHPDGRPYADGDWSMARCLASGAVIAAEEVEIQRFDGTRRSILGSCAPIFGPDGRLQGALSVFADITEFRQLASAERVARERMVRLQAVTTALCEAALPSEVARVVAVEMTAVLGAHGAAMLVPSDDGTELVLVRHAELDPDAPSRFPIDGDHPLAVTFRTASPLYRSSREDHAQRLLRTPWDHATGDEATAFVPILAQGARLGVIGFGFATGREFDDADRTLIANLARHAGLALERARLFESEQRARREADAAKTDAELLFQLAEATASTTELSTLHHLALASVIKLLKVDRAAILLVDDHDGVMRFKAWCGLSDAYRRAVEGHSPWRSDTTEARPILIADVDADDRMIAYRPVFAAEGIRALGFVPLFHGRRLLGKLMVYCDAPRVFSRPDEHLATTIASHIALAVERTRLFAAERSARERATFLLEASTILASDLDYHNTLRQLALLAIPRIADWCAVEIADAPSILHPVEPAKIALARALLRPDSPDPSGDPRMQRARLVEHIDDATLATIAGDAEQLQRLRELDLRSSIRAPMSARGRTFGALTFVVAGPGRRYGPLDLELADLLGRRAGIAIDNARLFAAEARARTEAERLAEQAQAASRAREDVLAVVSHDLRSPLNAIAVSAGALLRIELDDERKGARIRKSAEIIHRSTERMTRMIGDLIDFASIQAGHLSICRAPVAAREIIDVAVELFGSLAHERELWLEHAVDDGLPPVDCDRDRAIQALSNLLANAVKVTASGGRVVVRARSRADEVVFVVEDTGPGIPTDELPRIFERYWRGNNARYHGTGLGLAIARGIIEAHGGRLWAESTVGVGSRFSFSLKAVTPGGD